MAKHRPSLEAFAQSAAPIPATAAPVANTEAIKVVQLASSDAAMTRKDRPHTTLYLSKKVQRVIKEIALQYDRKPHDLYLEGINLMLTQYGRPSINDISKD
jgi:hypothetical protein